MTNPHSFLISCRLQSSHFVWRNSTSNANKKKKKHCSILGWNFHHWNYHTFFSQKRRIVFFRSEISWLIGWFPNPELQSLQSSLIPFPKNRTNSCKYFSCFAPTAQVLRASTYGPEKQHPPVPRLPILVDSHWHLFDFPICSHLRVPHRSCMSKSEQKQKRPKNGAFDWCNQPGCHWLA